MSKKEKNKQRLVTTSNFTDKIVQQAIYFVLSAIYEPSFLGTSHGSRLDTGNHTALKCIKSKFQDVKWCIEAAIEYCSSPLFCQILLSFLKKRIFCKKFLTLVKRSIKAGVDENRIFNTLNKRCFQGNITSLIFTNVYFHELDVFMNGLCKYFLSSMFYWKTKSSRKVQFKIKKEFAQSQKKKRYKKSCNFSFKKLYYIRYVDTFVVGVGSSFDDAVSIKKIVKSFLYGHLNLIFSNQKSLITPFNCMSFIFLSTFIENSRQKKKLVKLGYKSRVLKKVRFIGSPVLKAPVHNLFFKAAKSGFLKKRYGKFTPTKVGRLINLDHLDVLIYYQSLIINILNFYSFANNKKSLNRFVYGLKFSCARTLALKYKQRYTSKIFSRFSSELKIRPDSVMRLFTH